MAFISTSLVLKPKTPKPPQASLFTMSVFKTLSHKFHTILKPQIHPHVFQITHSLKSSISLLSQTAQTFSTRVEQQMETENPDSNIKKKPIDLMFKEAVGLTETLENNESENEDNPVMKKLRELEFAVRKLKANKKGEEKLKTECLKKDTSITECLEKDTSLSKCLKEDKPKSLYSLFSKEKIKDERSKVTTREDGFVSKELSPDMEVFVSHLYTEGYFKTANFLPGNKLEFSCLENRYSRDYIKAAAAKFGKDNQEIAKWLSGSDLKKVALFGCPSIARKNVFAVKKLRRFFEIPEDTVCSKCVLKERCKFPNQSVWRDGGLKNLDLAVVMKVITLYALESVPPQLIVPDEVKASVSRLLKEVLKLRKTIA